jgi:hypothetical protein
MLNLLLYSAVGLAEWWLALGRTLACTRREPVTVGLLVCIENLLGFWVVSNFIKKDDWLIVVAYTLGASFGAVLATLRRPPPRTPRRPRKAPHARPTLHKESEHTPTPPPVG